MILDWIKSRISTIRRQYLEDKRNETKNTQVERNKRRDTPTSMSSQFEGDYTTACTILEKQLNQHFPDNYHARLRTDYNPLRDYSSARSDAIDKSSTEIARSLRAGDGVAKAVRLGAHAIGLE